MIKFKLINIDIKTAKSVKSKDKKNIENKNDAIIKFRKVILLFPKTKLDCSGWLIAINIELHTNKKNMYQGVFCGKKLINTSNKNNKIDSERIIIEIRKASFEYPEMLRFFLFFSFIKLILFGIKCIRDETLEKNKNVAAISIDWFTKNKTPPHW